MDNNKRVVELVQETLEANKEHLHALESYTQRLESELDTFDKLLDAANTVDESDLDVGSFVTIPGSVRATAPIATKEFLSPESPFYKDALKRNRYLNVSGVRSMKAKELDALAEAVQAESRRKRALDVQKRGSPALLNSDVQTPHVLGLDEEGIDWNRVAEKVSAISMTTRTARECEIRWLGEQHPEFNHEPWAHDEISKVKSLAAEFVDRQPDWVTVAKRLGTKRTPLDCMRHATSRKSHRWTSEADKRLLRGIRMYGHDNWHLVARYVSEDATPSQCSSRFQKTLDESITRTTWTPEEDARLSIAVAAYGSSWVDVAASVPGRHNDQCRERWTENLNPGINKSQWSEAEDKALVDYVGEHKDASWKQISEHLRNGRTEAMCRNRYAVLQRGANTVPVVSEAGGAVNQEASSSNIVSANSKPLCFKSSFPSLNTTPAPVQTGYNHPNQFVFLEPVVSSNPKSHKYQRPHSSAYKPRSKATTRTGDILPSNNSTTTPPSKKGKRTNKLSMQTPQGEFAN